MDSPDLSAERLRALISYNADTGLITRLVGSATGKVGDVAGYLDRKGYVRVKVGRLMHFAHRLIWLYTHSEWPPGQIDHINGIKNDNRLSNLRVVDNMANAQNKTKAHKINQCGLLGVSPDKGLWKAQITHSGGKRINLGRFKTPEEAHACYLAAKRRMHPGFVDYKGS